MAKQAGIIRLLGTIGNITFVKTEDGYLAKEKTSLSGDKIATSENFARTRENNSEFGNACIAGKLIRTSAHGVMKSAKDSKVTSRLVKYLMKALKLDSTSVRGERNVADGDVSVLQDFEFNNNAPLKTVLLPQYTGTIDRVAGTLNVDVPGLTPLNDIIAPEGTTHFTIVSAGLEIDFAGGTSVTGESASNVIALDNTLGKPISLSNAVTANSTNKLFLLLGVQFYQQVNGINYSLRNGAFNPLSMIEVSNS
jgi:hypothetical protein